MEETVGYWCRVPDQGAGVVASPVLLQICGTGIRQVAAAGHLGIDLPPSEPATRPMNSGDDNSRTVILEGAALETFPKYRKIIISLFGFPSKQRVPASG